MCAAAVSPFVPGAWQFGQRGIPDVLSTGDAAAIELRTLQAAHGAQLLGPYSRFDWSHPGPIFFYLAMPVYEAFGRRGPAINLFAFLWNLACVLSLVLLASRLRGDLFALLVAALVAVYALIGVPVLLANAWNPVFPMMALALLSFLAVHISVKGAGSVALPAFVFLASLIVQTHVGYAPEVLALVAVVFVSRSWLGKQSRIASLTMNSRWISVSSAAVLIVCWILPLSEAVSNGGGNLQRVGAFFWSNALSGQSWSTALTTVSEQMAVMPRALARVIAYPSLGPLDPDAGPRAAAEALAIAGAELVCLVGVLVAGVRRRDVGLTVLTGMLLAQILVALVAVHAIRGDVERYLVIWISLLGLMSLVAIAAWALSAIERHSNIRSGRAIAGLAALAMLALAIKAGTPTRAVFRDRDPAAEQLASSVETYLRSNAGDATVVRIAARETWPAAIAVVLHLSKRGVPVSVEPEWLFLAGNTFAPPVGRPRRSLVFGDEAYAAEAETRRDLALVASSGHVFVYVGG